MARVKSTKTMKRGLAFQMRRGRLNPPSIPSSPLPVGSPIINTPFRPRATLWRLKSKAKAAEEALHTAALLRARLSSSKTPSTHLSQAHTGASTPITGFGTATVNTTPYTTVALAGSEEDDSDSSQDTGSLNKSQSPDLVEEDDQDENYEDIEDIIQQPLGMDIEQMQPQSEEALADAQKLWPDVMVVAIQYGVLNKGIEDMKQRLSSADAPGGHDFTWHLQVLQFMNWEMRCLKIHQLLSPSARNEFAMNVAIGFGKGARVRDRILENEKRWIRERNIEKSKQGRISSMASMLEDEGTMIAVREFIASSGGGIRPESLCNAVSEYWQSQMPSVDRQQEIGLLSSSLNELDSACDTFTNPHIKLTIHASTARKWLKQLGYNWKEVKKGVYKDGHEREDVVEYRQNVFLTTLEALKPRMPYPSIGKNGEVEGVDIGCLPVGETLCIPVTHDEATCNANDGPHYQWIKGDENPLRKKSRGQGLHISEFITPYGRLSIPENEISDQDLIQRGFHKREATEIIQCGGDIWWDQDHIVQQTLLAVNIFEAAYPGCQALFLFDNATSHSAFAEDALRVTRMNKGPGGEQAHMRDGYWFQENGEKVVQAMNYDEDDMSVAANLRGKPKGLQIILQERGLWPKGDLYLDCSSRRTSAGGKIEHQKPNCCARMLLSQQPDFLGQKGRVQEVVEAKGHMVLFYPRFHCELNWIEYFWARVKLYTRTHCGYDIKSLRKNVPLALEEASSFIPKWWAKSLRIMDVYRNGTVYGTEEFKVKAYKSHRRISAKDAILL